MKPQEVISELNRLKSGRGTTDYDRRDKAIETAKEAVGYRIPRKPLRSKDSYMHSTRGYCPNCNAEMICDWLYRKLKKEGGTSVGYCHVCGQAIDWGDEK